MVAFAGMVVDHVEKHLDPGIVQALDHVVLNSVNCSKKDLLRDLQRASEFDQSAMFKKVYEEEFGIFGGHPFGALIGDYEFGKRPEDMELLEKVSQVAAAAHAPFLTAATSNLFNLDSYSELSAPRDLAKIFDTTEYAKWKSFRAFGRFALRGLDPAAYPDARSLREGLPVRWTSSITKRPWTAPTTTSISGGTPPGPWARASPSRSPVTTGAPPSAAWKAAEKWRA